MSKKWIKRSLKPTLLKLKIKELNKNNEYNDINNSNNKTSNSNSNSLPICMVLSPHFQPLLDYTGQYRPSKKPTRHIASTSMYSQTFCVRVMLPERHQWKPAVQAAAVMLRTPPADGQSPASSARRPRRAFALCCHITRWAQDCN